MNIWNVILLFYIWIILILFWYDFCNFSKCNLYLPMLKRGKHGKEAGLLIHICAVWIYYLRSPSKVPWGSPNTSRALLDSKLAAICTVICNRASRQRCQMRVLHIRDVGTREKNNSIFFLPVLFFLRSCREANQLFGYGVLFCEIIIRSHVFTSQQGCGRGGRG